MNDDRIRRALRRPGPREPRIEPAALPSNIHAARALARDLRHRGRGATVLRAVGGLALAAAAVVVAAFVGVQLLGNAPAPGGPGIGDTSGSPVPASASPTSQPSSSPQPASPTPEATPAAPATLARCSAASLSATSQTWGAAAGSRGTTVTITNTGSVACTLRGNPGASLTDANGGVLATAAEFTSASDPTVTVTPGGSVVTSIVWGNWCAAAPAQPIAAGLVVGGVIVAVTPTAAGSQIPVPPCLGTGGTSFSTIIYQAAP